MTDDLHDLPPSERALALRLRQRLRDSESLDFVTTSRLSAARARALDGRDAGRRSTWWWASGGLAAAAVAVIAVLVFAPALRTPGVVAEPAAADSLDILTDDVDPELYEDLELYRWLAQEGNRV